MTPKQRLFVCEYLKDFNATRAYVRAGFAAKTEASAAVQAHKLLRNGKVAEAVEAAVKERERRVELDADGVLREIKRLVFSRVTDALKGDGQGVTKADIEALSDDVKAAIASVEFGPDGTVRKLKMWDKTRTLELAAKHLGLVKDRVQLEDDRLDFEMMPAEDLLIVKAVLERQKARQEAFGRKKLRGGL